MVASKRPLFLKGGCAREICYRLIYSPYVRKGSQCFSKGKNLSQIYLVLELANIVPHFLTSFFADDSLVFLKASNKECHKLKEVLEVYEKATGQVINFEKSECLISKNVEVEAASHLSRILGVRQSYSIGQYLSLPAQTGRHKGRMFNKLREKVWKMLQGWKGPLFS